MSCRRAFEVDLAGFLMDPRAEAFASFLDHYPRCSECSAEVGVWTQLERELSTPAEAHPDPAALDRYERGVDLPETERTRLERHLSACVSCRDELQALRSFRPEQLQAPEARAAKSRPGTPFVDKLRRLAWSPGFAYALLALVLGPAIYMALDSTPLLQERAVPDVLTETASPMSVERGAPRPEEEDEAMATVRDVPAQPARKSQVAERKAAQPPRSEPPRGEPSREASAVEQQALPVTSELQAASMRAAAKDVRKPEMEASMEEARPVAPGAMNAMAFSMAPGAVRLRAGVEVTVAAAAALAGVHLVAPLPAGLASENTEIRLAEASGRRELRERSRAGRAADVVLRVPAGWLEPGLYRVGIHDVRADASDAPLALFQLRVARE